MSEAELQDAVIDLAHLLGWQVAHFRPARTDRGWRTPVAADGAGFPDCVLVRDRVVYAELKSSKGALSVAQRRWLDSLDRAGAEVYIWRPADWTSGAIEQVLRPQRQAS
jgi:VRR-NUC domain-containing protein